MELGLVALLSIAILSRETTCRSVPTGQLVEQRGNALLDQDGNSTLEVILPSRGGSPTTSRILQSLREGFLAEAVEVPNFRLGQEDGSLDFLEGTQCSFFCFRFI
jgi:hypothetical protein